MIRNILYSLFFHLIIVLLIYFNFSLSREKEIENKTTISVSFVNKTGNSTNTTNQILKNNKEPDKVEKIAEKSPEPKKEDVPKKDKKIPQPKQKNNKKIVKKESKSKTNINDIKVKNIEPPKATRTAKEAPEEKILKTEEVKNEEAPLIKKEQKPEIVKENSKEDVKDVESVEEQEQQEMTIRDSPNAKDFEDKQKLENIDLLFREKFNIELQIKRCYKRAIIEAGRDSKVPVIVHVIIDRDGGIDLDLVTIQDYEKYSDPAQIDFHIAVDNARRALTLCSPLRNLPEDKFDVWREMTLQFDEGMKK